VPFLDIAARQITLQSQAVCAMASWWNLIPASVFSELRESEYPGGMAHGCELETSVLLYLRPDLVQFEKAERDIQFQASKFFYWDLQRPSPIAFQEWFSRYSATGTVGDPTKATKEKGERFVNAVVDGLVELICEFRNREIRPRVDHH
jgi:creatinine amidohydrolase